MERHQINPPLSADGQVIGEGDFDAQARQTFENVGAVLEQAGAGFDAVVLNDLWRAGNAPWRMWERRPRTTPALQ